jgi:hypothetical protein
MSHARPADCRGPPGSCDWTRRVPRWVQWLATVPGKSTRAQLRPAIRVLVRTRSRPGMRPRAGTGDRPVEPSLRSAGLGAPLPGRFARPSVSGARAPELFGRSPGRRARSPGFLPRRPGRWTRTTELFARRAERWTRTAELCARRLGRSARTADLFSRRPGSQARPPGPFARKLPGFPTRSRRLRPLPSREGLATHRPGDASRHGNKSAPHPPFGHLLPAARGEGTSWAGPLATRASCVRASALASGPALTLRAPSPRVAGSKNIVG